MKQENSYLRHRVSWRVILECYWWCRAAGESMTWFMPIHTIHVSGVNFADARLECLVRHEKKVYTSKWRLDGRYHHQTAPCTLPTAGRTSPNTSRVSLWVTFLRVKERHLFEVEESVLRLQEGRPGNGSILDVCSLDIGSWVSPWQGPQERAQVAVSEEAFPIEYDGEACIEIYSCLGSSKVGRGLRRQVVKALAAALDRSHRFCLLRKLLIRGIVILGGREVLESLCVGWHPDFFRQHLLPKLVQNVIGAPTIMWWNGRAPDYKDSPNLSSRQM